MKYIDYFKVNILPGQYDKVTNFTLSVEKNFILIFSK